MFSIRSIALAMSLMVTALLAPAQAEQPLVLQKYMTPKGPIATAAQRYQKNRPAVRTTQTRPVRTKVAKRRSVPKPLPAVASPTVNESVAPQPAVQVVSADELSELDRMADDVKVVSAEEVNELDNASEAVPSPQALTSTPVEVDGYDANARALHEPEDYMWMRWMLAVLAGAFAAAAIGARLLMGRT